MDEGRARFGPSPPGRRPVASLAGQPEAGPDAVIGLARGLPGPTPAALPVCRSRGVRHRVYRAPRSSSVRLVRFIRQADAASRHVL